MKLFKPESEKSLRKNLIYAYESGGSVSSGSSGGGGSSWGGYGYGWGYWSQGGSTQYGVCIETPSTSYCVSTSSGYHKEVH